MHERVMKDTSGHSCPDCKSILVYIEKFSRSESGIFYNFYKCSNCGKEFENTPSHKESDSWK